MKTKQSMIDARKIRALLRVGKTTTQIIEELNVTRTQVYSARYYLKSLRLQFASAISKEKIVQRASEVAAAPVDMINHPPHYKVGGIETIEYIKAKLTRAEYIGYLKGNVIKYSSRVGYKGEAAQDAGKIGWYATELAKALA